MAREMTDYEKKVRKALIDRDMNLSDLAAETGVSVTYLYDILSGARKATKLRQEINDFLGLDGEG